MQLSYAMQLKEGMEPLPEEPDSIGYKYAGGGFGGYAVYLFEETARRDAFVRKHPSALAIEPYLSSDY